MFRRACIVAVAISLVTAFTSPAQTASAQAAPAQAAPAGAASSSGAVVITVLSGRPDQVSGGDALVGVRLRPGLDPARLRVHRNGEDVTAAFRPDGANTVSGLVTGLRLGGNTLTATAGPHHATLRLRDHPISGPIFSGPQQYPFLCKTERTGLGPPTVDNQDGQGMRVEGGWSKDCFAPTVVDRLYRSTSGEFKPMPAVRPADMTTTTLLDGRTVDFVVRRERGVINRFLYSMRRSRTAGTAAPSTASTAASRSAMTRAPSAAARWSRTRSARATRSCTPRARVRPRTTTSSSAARPR